ncbi:MAG: T9SS type A sorting domain-containing protein, partial [Bacteroidetes bacterium]|nr:T9SS type A sorting domain-containing protein [Bacteroidota bacterium]
TVSVDVMDAFGKLVATRTIPAQGGYLKTSMSFERELAPGLYLINVRAGGTLRTQRLVIQ